MTLGSAGLEACATGVAGLGRCCQAGHRSMVEIPFDARGALAERNVRPVAAILAERPDG